MRKNVVGRCRKIGQQRRGWHPSSNADAQTTSVSLLVSIDSSVWEGTWNVEFLADGVGRLKPLQLDSLRPRRNRQLFRSPSVKDNVGSVHISGSFSFHKCRVICDLFSCSRPSSSRAGGHCRCRPPCSRNPHAGPNPGFPRSNDGLGMSKRGPALRLERRGHRRW